MQLIYKKRGFMNCFYRFLFSLITVVVLICSFVSTPAYSLSTSIIPTTAEDFFKLGIEKMLYGNYQGAIPEFQQAIQQKQDFAPAYSNRCLAYLNIQDYQNAIADCTQAINFSPKNAEAYLNRGIAEYRLGYYEAAIADDEQAIALRPSDFRAYYNRGITNASLEKYQQAITDYNLALTQIPQIDGPLLADIYNDRGLARLELADLQNAMLDFNRAIRLNAVDYRAYFNRGCACARREDYAGAVDNFTKVIRLNPSDGSTYISRGIAFHRLGYEQAAIADLLKAADYFGYQGEKVAYEKTLSLIKTVQGQILFKVVVA
jgi:tetratricopeptide (TPR) repeat protein